MADKIIAASLQLNSEQANQSMKSFKTELREAQADLINVSGKFGDTSKQAIAAAQRVAELRDRIGDANSLVAAFNPDRKFAALGQAVQGVTGGFAALQGILGLIGVDSENVQKQLLKVQSALALTQGLDNIRESVQGFKNLGVVIKDLIGGAIAPWAIGITAVVAAYTALSNFLSDDLDPQLEKTAKEKEKLVEASEAVAQASSLEERQLRATGSTDSEVLKVRIKNISVLIGALNEQLAAEQAILTERQNALTQEIGLTAALKGSAQTGILSDILGFFGVGDSKKVDEQIKKVNDISGKIKEAQVRLLETQKEIQDIAKKEAGKDGGKTFTPLPSIEEPGKESAELTQFKLETEQVLGLRKSLIDSAKFQTDMEKTYAEARVAYAEYERQAKVKAAQDIGSALGALSDLVGRQTVAGKVLGIAQATINTFIGATEVLRAKSVLPEPFGTISKIANVTAIIATGLAAVRNIVKTQVPGGGSGSAPSIATSANAPLQPAPQVGTTQLDQQSISQVGNSSIRAFVLTEDVNNNQERLTRLNRAARLTG